MSWQILKRGGLVEAFTLFMYDDSAEYLFSVFPLSFFIVCHVFVIYSLSLGVLLYYIYYVFAVLACWLCVAVSPSKGF